MFGNKNFHHIHHTLQTFVNRIIKNVIDMIDDALRSKHKYTTLLNQVSARMNFKKETLPFILQNVPRVGPRLLKKNVYTVTNFLFPQELVQSYNPEVHHF